METSGLTSVNSKLTKRDVSEMLSISNLQTQSISGVSTCPQTVLDPDVKKSPKLLPDMVVEELDTEKLTTKNAVEFLLNGTLKKKVCRYCLTVTSHLSELDQILQVAGQGVLYKVTIREMVASFHPIQAADDPNFPNKICEKCIDRTLSSYLFSQQCERSERALRNCFEDMFEKLEKLDSLEKPKKRGRSKINPNYNVLAAAYENVIDYAEPLITIINTDSELSTCVENSDALICQKCCQKLPNHASLLNHEKQHPSTMWFHCHLCGKSFPKRFQLKRHIISVHDSGKLILIKNTDYKCQDCGVVNKDYHSHLQHIEKHKFHEVMEHLLTRKMDKLCAVCLNKGSKLVELEKMICLHGGYPEMMGDRTLYNILGSTVPEKSKSKYQDLHISSKTKVLNLVRINKNKDLTTIDKTLVSSKQEDNSDVSFIFSLPNYYVLEVDNPISNHNTGSPIDSNKNVKKIERNEVVNETYKTNLDNNLTKVSNVSGPINNELKLLPCENTKEDKTVVNIHSSMSSEQYVDKGKEENTESVPRLCETCWLFKKTDCKSCIHCTSVTKLDDNKQCSSCWLFKNCKQCGLCEKLNTDNILINATIDLTKTSYINLGVQKDKEETVIVDHSTSSPSKAVDTCQTKNVQCAVNETKVTNYDGSKTDEPKDFSNTKIKTVTTLQLDNRSSKAEKRKTTEKSSDNEAKRSKWQCRICSVMNWNRESCFCCNTARSYSNVKYNFKLNNDFFKDLNNNNDDLITTESKTEVIENTLEYQIVLKNDKTNQSSVTSIICNDGNTADLVSICNKKPAISISHRDSINNDIIVDENTTMIIDQNENILHSSPAKSFFENMEIDEELFETNLVTNEGTQNQNQELKLCARNLLMPPLVQFSKNARKILKPKSSLVKLKKTKGNENCL